MRIVCVIWGPARLLADTVMYMWCAGEEAGGAGHGGRAVAVL